MRAEDAIKCLQEATGRGERSSDFDLNPGLCPPDRVLRPAAVLLAFELCSDGLQLYLTQRASGLKHHPGQIAFPGGKVDAADAGIVSTALREAEEEIGLPRDNVKILGTLPAHETVTSFSVTPVVGLIHRPFVPRAEAGEVDEIFTVPFDHIAKPENFIVESRYFRGVRRHFYTVPYGPHYIWGATARMLFSLSARLNS